MKKMFSTGDVGEIIGVDRNTVLGWITNKTITGVVRTLGGHFRIPENEVKKILEKSGWSDEEITQCLAEKSEGTV